MATGHNPSISVVIPTHNTRDLAVAAVSSVLEHAPEATEVVVVDDGSADGTLEAMTTFGDRVRTCRNEVSTGFAEAANRGLAAAHSELLLLLNSDAELTPGCIEPLVEAFETDQKLGIAGAELVFPDNTPQWSGGSFPSPIWAFVLTSGAARLAQMMPSYRSRKYEQHRGLTAVDWVTGAAIAVRRTLWEDVGPFDNGYEFYAQDMDLCRTAAAQDWTVQIVRGFRVIHHHGATIGRSAGAAGKADPSLLWSDILRFINKHEGPSAARRTRFSMVLGARARLIWRVLSTPLQNADNRSIWRRDTKSYRNALRRVQRTRLSRDNLC